MEILERAALEYAQAEQDGDFFRARRRLRQAVYTYVKALGATRVTCGCGCGAWWYATPSRLRGRPRKYLNADHRELAKIRRRRENTNSPPASTITREARE